MDQLLFEQHPSPMLIYDLDTLKILKTNTAFSQKYGYSEDDVAEGLTIEEIRPEEERDKLRKIIRHLNTEGVNESGVHRHQSKDGELFYVQVISQSFAYEGYDSRLVVCHDWTEQVEAERKTQKAYDELQHHISNSPLAYVEWDPGFHISKWSDQAEKISGYSEAEVIGTSIFNLELFDRDEAREIKQLIESLVTGDRRKNQFETRIRHKEGHQVYIKIHSSILRSTDNELRSVLTLIEDITEQKKSEIKYQRLFENANDSILLLKDQVFVDCNKEAEKLFGASHDDIVGSTPAQFSPEVQPNGGDSLDEARKRINKALDEGSNLFEWQHENSDGDLIDVEVSLNKIDFPDGEFVQAIVRDITSKKRTQAELKKNEVLFRNLFLKSPAALVMVDRDDRVKVVNESFEQMFGYQLSDVQGKNLDDLIVPAEDDSHAPSMRDEAYVDKDFRTEGVRIAKAGEEKHVLITAMPVYVDGELIAGLGMYIDISDRKKWEQELKKSLKDKQVLLEEVHHRVKNNLAVVSGLLEMQTLHVDDEQLTKYIQNSQLRIKSMAIVHEMLYQSSTLSEIEFKQYVEKLADVISEVLAPRAKNITIEVDAEDIILNVNQAIPCALVISELITNAYEYAFEGRDQGLLEITVCKEGDHIDVEVKDDGIGLPEDFEEKRKKSLGINLMENLCQQLETVIEIDSGDWGTAFSFAFQKSSASGSSSTNRVDSTIDRF